MIIGMELINSKCAEQQEIPLEWMVEKYNALVKEGLPYEAMHFQYTHMKRFVLIASTIHK